MEVTRQLNGIFNRVNKNGCQRRSLHSETISFNGKINILSETNKQTNTVTLSPADYLKRNSKGKKKLIPERR